MTNASTVERLAALHLKITGDHYREGPTSRDRVYENLNALAIAVAAMIAPIGAEAQKFFDTALKNQINEFQSYTAKHGNGGGLS